MMIKNFIGKNLKIEELLADIKNGNFRGVKFHEKGIFDKDHRIIEMVIGHTGGYTYAFKLYIEETTILKIERLKFQWECGGWRSADHILKRFPLHFCAQRSSGEIISCEKASEEILADYIERAKKVS